MSDINTITVGGTQYNIGGGSGGLLPHIVITSEAENTITVTTPSGSTITPTSTVSGVWECDVDEYGIYTIDATYSGHDAEETVNVDTVKVYPVEIHVTTVPDGKTVTPTDDISMWLACGQISDVSYTTLSQVLADAETYERLLSDSNACDYMARSTTWASTICADADAMMRLGKYDYACDALLADSTWASAISSSTYFEYVLDVKVPTMTSNTTPSGTVSRTTVLTTSTEGYKAFDGNTQTGWLANGSTNERLSYCFTSPQVINKVSISNFAYDGNTKLRIKNFKIECRNGSDAWQTLYTGVFSGSYTGDIQTYSFENATPYEECSILVVDTETSDTKVGINNVQFYGRHTAQTDIIVTAHGGDTVYYMENGSPVTLTTADSDTGIGTVDWSDLPKGAITLYSSTAKNPSDLTADYSKTVYITEYTTQIYLMPDNALYWYGWESSDLEDMSSANGWSFSTNGIVAPTHNTYSIRLTSSNNAFGGVGSKTAISCTTAKSIVKGVTLSAVYTDLCWTDTKSLNRNNVASATTDSLQLLTLAVNGTKYISQWEYGGRAADLYALWHE